MSTASRNLIQFLCASVAVMLLAVALNFIVDPLQLFRPARFYQPMYSNDSRMQDAGLIRSQSFDTVFMGTSLGVHYRQSDIDRALGVRSVKLAMTGPSNSGIPIDTLRRSVPRGVACSACTTLLASSTSASICRQRS